MTKYMSRTTVVSAILTTTAFLWSAPPASGDCAGDLNGDLEVDLADLAQLLGSYDEMSGMSYEQGDIDGDGDVDLSDLAALLGVYGEACAPDGMAVVEAGRYEMGSPEGTGFADEHPVHSVGISRFYIDKYEVTNAFYAEFLNAGGNDDHWCSYQQMTREGVSPPYIYAPLEELEHRPAVYVTYYDAIAFCEWRTTAENRPSGFYRLPTEAEWEKAAGWDPEEERHYVYGYHLAGICCNMCNYYRDPACVGHTTDVGHYNGEGETFDAKSYYGAYDMSGNVDEWCSDWYSADYYENSPDTDPTGPETGDRRVIRGGPFHNTAIRVRSASRGSLPPTWIGGGVGFRCAGSFP